jgi:hypothetical protein
MNEAHERHLHLLECIDRVNSAWRTLKLIEANLDHPLSGPAFRYALVEYSTAFNRSYSPLKKPLRLAADLVPTDFFALHTRIIEARDKVHAHADLNVLESVLVSYEFGNRREFGRIANFIHGLEELKNLPEVISLVENLLQNLYAKRDDEEQQLTLSK